MITTLFWNSERRLRAGWRILLFILMFIGFSIVVQEIVKWACGGVPKTTEYMRSAILFSIVAVSATLAVVIARRLLDRKSVLSLGLKLDRNAAADTLFGFVLSGLMAAAVFGVMLAFGLIEFHGLNWGNADEQLGWLAAMSLGPLAIMFLVDVVVGWWEELVFRGYLLQNFAEGMGWRLAIGVSCLLYGLIHMSNPNAGWLSGAIIVFFGFLRIYGYLCTKQLWLSFGMHVGWNFFQGPIFGYPASGHDTVTLVSQSPSGPAYLSGGAFGPEGSILIIPILGLALVAMNWWSKRNRAVELSKHSESSSNLNSAECLSA